MKLVKQKSLTYTEGRSDKVYEVDLCETPSGHYLVNFRYGRRGSTLREGTKTTSPVDLPTAERLFDELVESKTKKGYTDTPVVRVATVAADVSVPTSDQTDSRTNAILQRLARGPVDDYRVWSISRTVWRAGELKIAAAEPLFKPLVGDNEMLDYSIAWALGRIGLNSSMPILEEIGSFRIHPQHVKDIAKESMRLCGNDQQRKALINGAIDALPPLLNAAYTIGDSNAFLLALKNHLTSADLRAAEVLNIVYFIDDPITRPALLAVLDYVPLKVNYFRPIRRLYKAAELRGDAEVFGVIARRIEIEPGTFNVSYWPKARKAESIARDDSNYGYSRKTRRYLRNRSWQRLRQLGRDGSSDYVPMAVGVLLPFKDSDETYSPAMSLTQYDWQTRTYSSRDRERMGKFWAFSNVLHHNSLRHDLKSVRAGFFLRPELDVDSQPASFQPDTEAFPHLWKAQPKGLLHLLMESQCKMVHDFAAPVMRACGEFCERLDLSVIKKLLEKPYESTLSLAVELAVDRYDPRNPDLELVATLCNCGLESARKIAHGWIARDRREFYADQSFAFETLTSDHADTRKVAVDSVSSMPREDAFKEGLVARLLAFMLGLGDQGLSDPQAMSAVTDVATAASTRDRDIVSQTDEPAAQLESNENSTESDVAAESSSYIPLIFSPLADDISKALQKSYFSDQMETLGEDVLCDLLASNVAEVQSLAAETILRHKTLKRNPTQQILSALLDATHAPVRATGIQILSDLSDDVLIQNVDLFCQLTAHPLIDIRAEIRPVAKRLADRKREFARELVLKLIERILTPGAPEGVPTHLSTVLREDFDRSLEHITQDTVWELLQSRSQPAQEVGGFLLPTHVKSDSLKVIEIVKLADHDILTVRQAAWKMFDDDESRMEKSLVTAVRILDSSWEDSREFGFDFLRTKIDQKYLTPEVLISICDSVRPDVQRFGRELITREFTAEAGPDYLLKLSEHPTADLQLFVTNYLVDFGSDNLERLETLEPYFVSILSRVNQSRVAKDRVFSFLQVELQKSEAAAKVIGPILDRISATCAVGDKATTIELMVELRERYPEIGLPIELKPVETR